MTTTQNKRSKHEKFDVIEIERSEIKNAPYNPRKINEDQKKGLRKNLKKVGLLQPLIWNKRTGNLVSGHQRISIIDALEGGYNYKLTVSAVDLDDKTEKEQNIFLNSTTFTGEFDFDLLKDLLPEIDAFAAGLDDVDLNIIGVDAEMKSGGNDEEDEFFGDVKKAKKDVKDAKKRAQENIEARFEEGERYLTLSFDSYDAKVNFASFFGLDEDDLYVKGEFFIKLLKDNGVQI